jgi:hypothetical protein
MESRQRNVLIDLPLCIAEIERLRNSQPLGEGRLQERIDRFLASKACSRNPGCPWDDRADRLCYQCEARELITLLSALSVPAAPPRSEQFQRVLQEMEGAADQYGLGETLAVALHSWVRQLESLAVVSAAPPPQEQPQEKP